MGGSAGSLQGPDLTVGVEAENVPEGGVLLGHAHGEAALLFRRGDEICAVGATCSHYGGPLAEGLVVGTAVHCPWHHARFDLRTGEAIGAPALKALPCWQVERQGTRVVVKGPAPARLVSSPAGAVPESVVIVGAGAAGNAAAETLRCAGYGGPVTMIGAEDTLPTDRPNLSKDYLAGTAPEEWIPLRDPDFYRSQQIELLLGVRVTALHTERKTLTLSDGSTRSYGALLLATGADPVKLAIPGADTGQVFTLRSLADSRRIIAKAQSARRAVVIGASFIGLETAAALRTRGLEVDVVGPEARPLERVLGPALGDFVRALHEEHGVRFHLKHGVQAISDGAVTLDDGSSLLCDLVVTGVGVRPAVALAEQAGLRLDRGVVVNEFLATSAPGVFAAGDIARWPDARSGQAIRVEHWVVAERQGQAAARNILGRRQPFRDVPFFWSQHYDVPIAYVGHAEGWETIHVVGSISGKDCLVGYRSGGRIAAVASIYRDQDSLKIEAAMERNDQAAVEAFFS
ncbi:MAG TPA: FAD-dependent oxidoreductase [Polyangia bacterium]|jgi:NADPH-dependent 2,4-dienoyl-CoA reductase/sulfur reductase-like enzyme/nitrite reductase/ring-hydroxylating ferredoxin subunit|nr:FAD-dependent oxidoreductase [Polyangia bacterium]